MRGQWSVEKVNAWWNARDWACGFNYLPASSVNFLEMWMEPTFDRDGIRRELAWAARAGFNAVRTNLHYLVWEKDRDGLMERFRWFLDTAMTMGISTIPVLFDDCGFGGFEPIYGQQPQPVPRIHNSRAVASPGRASVMDKRNWPGFERYVKDVISLFGDDPKVLLWDLYNEPGNRAIFERLGKVEYCDPSMTEFSKELMEVAFEWARDVAPSQPLTVAAWSTPQAGHSNKPFDTEIDRGAIALSDVVSFHAYSTPEEVIQYIDNFQKLGRPIMITEWMARTIGSRFDNQLHLFHERKLGCFNWGLVQGRSQTHLPWPQTVEALGNVEEAGWFHDVFRPDGSPYDPSEVNLISTLTARKET